tara:strand:+ start:2192 stop:2515 length:324 start_codon:yes stop_codon:yes gene_type:complete
MSIQDFRLVYMTTKDVEEALLIGKALLAERLVACVNIIPGITSLFWWEDEIQETKETVILAKTTVQHLDALVERVKEHHSYDCPCVVAVPIEEGNQNFLNWIKMETS